MSRSLFLPPSCKALALLLCHTSHPASTAAQKCRTADANMQNFVQPMCLLRAVKLQTAIVKHVFLHLDR